MKRRLRVIGLVLAVCIMVAAVSVVPTMAGGEYGVCSKCGYEFTNAVGEQSEVAKSYGLTLCIDCWMDAMYGAEDCIELPNVATLGEDGKVLPDQLPEGSGGGMVIHGNDWHDPDFELADPAIQDHINSAHAPSDAQKNSDITKAEIENVLTGEITTHTHPGGSGGGLVVSGAVVFSGSSPTNWTDIDLSGVIGSNSALVILSIDANADMDATAVRTKGDSSEYWNTTIENSAYGVALAHHDSSATLVLMCVADSSGVIQWITEVSRTATITLIAYIN